MWTLPSLALEKVIWKGLFFRQKHKWDCLIFFTIVKFTISIIPLYDRQPVPSERVRRSRAHKARFLTGRWPIGTDASWCCLDVWNLCCSERQVKVSSVTLKVRTTRSNRCCRTSHRDRRPQFCRNDQLICLWQESGALHSLARNSDGILTGSCHDNGQLLPNRG